MECFALGLAQRRIFRPQPSALSCLLLPRAEGTRQEARLPLEELVEVRGVLEAQVVTYLLDVHVAKSQQPLGLEREARVDEAQRRESCRLGGVLRERLLRHPQHARIFAHRVHASVVALQQLAKLDEGAMLGRGDGVARVGVA